MDTTNTDYLMQFLGERPKNKIVSAVAGILQSKGSLELEPLDCDLGYSINMSLTKNFLFTVLQYFSGMWMGIDIIVLYSHLPGFDGVYHFCGVFGTVSLLIDVYGIEKAHYLSLWEPHKTCLRGFGVNGITSWTSALLHVVLISSAFKIWTNLQTSLLQMVIMDPKVHTLILKTDKTAKMPKLLIEYTEIHKLLYQLIDCWIEKYGKYVSANSLPLLVSYRINRVSDRMLSGSDPNCRPVVARYWMFLGLFIGFSAILGSLWAMSEYLATRKAGEPAYPGIELFLQNLLIAGSSALMRFWKEEEECSI